MLEVVRKKRGMNKTQFAKLFGMGQANYCRRVRNSGDAKVSVALKIMRKLNIDLNELNMIDSSPDYLPRGRKKNERLV